MKVPSVDNPGLSKNPTHTPAMVQIIALHTSSVARKSVLQIPAFPIEAKRHKKDKVERFVNYTLKKTECIELNFCQSSSDLNSDL